MWTEQSGGADNAVVGILAMQQSLSSPPRARRQSRFYSRRRYQPSVDPPLPLLNEREVTKPCATLFRQDKILRAQKSTPGDRKPASAPGPRSRPFLSRRDGRQL